MLVHDLLLFPDRRHYLCTTVCCKQRHGTWIGLQGFQWKEFWNGPINRWIHDHLFSWSVQKVSCILTIVLLCYHLHWFVSVSNNNFFSSLRLLSKEFVLLKSLGNYFPFECTVGMNGKVWINASSTSHTIIIANAITNSEYMTNNQVESMVKQIVNGI